jgi:hypothetical protein
MGRRESGDLGGATSHLLPHKGKLLNAENDSDNSRVPLILPVMAGLCHMSESSILCLSGLRWNKRQEGRMS